VRLLVSTDKGLLVYELETANWSLRRMDFLGMPVGTVMVDKRSGRWWAALNHRHWGPKLHFSDDEGTNWTESPAPRFPEVDGTAVKSIWTLAYGAPDAKERFYVGVEPAALFITENNGKTFRNLPGLSNHPTRKSWQGGGKGSKDPFLHTVIVDNENVEHLYVAISCAGVFQSYDTGETWVPTNNGVDPIFSTEESAEIGQDPHALSVAETNHDMIWQQNHRGIFISQNRGEDWANASDGEGLASYGFAMAVDEKNENRAWVVPAQSDDLRIPHNNALAVYMTEDRGNSWTPQTSGLPQEPSFDLVLRDGMDISGGHLVFGTNNGNLYHSSDLGKNWRPISQNLATIRSVRLIK